jgi:hypothetical protein
VLSEPWFTRATRIHSNAGRVRIYVFWKLSNQKISRYLMASNDSKSRI